MGVFRKRWDSYYAPKRKTPTVTLVVPDVFDIYISKVHPSRNIKLRDDTFRSIDYWYYQSKRKALPSSEFVPGILNAPSKVHPSRNLRLRDGTFELKSLENYRLRRKLPSSEFVPGALNAKHPRLKNAWQQKTEYRYFRLRRQLPPSITVIPDVSLPLISKVHPSRNLRLRDGTFKIKPINQYQPKRVLPPSEFILEVILARHSRLGQIWDTKTEYRYYRRRRILPPSEFIPGISIVISKVHPSRNIKLRDETFRPPFRSYYQPKYLYLNVTPFVGDEPDAMFKEMYRGMFRRMEPH